MLQKPRTLQLFVLLALLTPCSTYVPPPWVILWGVFAFAKIFNLVKEIVSLVIEIIFGAEDAACTLCDKIITVLLAGDADGGVDDIVCSEMCFRLNRCTIICEKLKNALASSAHFPCVSAGYCPAVDEFGPLPTCKYKFPTSCEPSNMCTFKFPRCKLSKGYLQWRRMKAMLSDTMGSVLGTLTNMPKCGEPGAHSTFCINEPHGTGLYCKKVSYLLYAYAYFKTVMAIESRGGDDDRQWLSFWLIYLILTAFESLTDVLLSWLPIYFEMKFLFLIWLIFFKGADILYRKVHSMFQAGNRLLIQYKILEEKVQQEWSEEDYLCELPIGLAQEIRQRGGTATPHLLVQKYRY